MKKSFVCIALMLFLAACNTSSQRSQVTFSEALPDSEGEQLYLDMKCPSCHDHQGSGDGFFSGGLLPKPVDFSSAETMKSIPDAQLQDAIRNGKGASMPNYAKLTDHQVAELVRYIRSLAQSPSN